ncbi:hypothetical protein BT67DRAFT_434459 [Trichocladium antarcticum]|uniref:Uncharacterized protein n=1 Tax=Trichocladium antarcticum TaxID=1450529 RepID=A0AAN6UKF6_9PEZI|nr:hypothetical protein BT67DRAFT_434459 [Trichocladium antarcticum]
MAAVESTQYERDFRSARKEWKRSKDSTIKWHHGRRPLPGIHFPTHDLDMTSPDSSHLAAKSRPGKKPSDSAHNYPKNSQNRIKPRPSWSIPAARTRTLTHARAEIRDATAADEDDDDHVPAAPPFLSPAPPLLSFDRASTPGLGAPLTLAVFVKTTAAGRETERLVEREVFGANAELG